MYIICMYVYNLLCNIFVIMSLEGGNIVFMITSRLGLSIRPYIYIYICYVYIYIYILYILYIYTLF